MKKSTNKNSIDMNLITLTYVTLDRMVTVVKNITIEEYFDLDKGEVLTINSSPKFSNPYEYSEVETKNLLHLILVLNIGNEKRTFKQTFWNNGDNIFTERIDEGIVNDKEIILSIKLKEKEFETIRLVSFNEIYLPLYHAVFEIDKYGNEVEIVKSDKVFLDILKERIKL